MAAGLLACAGCSLLPSSQARMRAQAQSEVRPATVYEPLLALHAALLTTDGVEREVVEGVTQWIARGVRTLRGPHPETWEAEARPDWPRVRSWLGPYDTLQPFAAVFDRLLQ
jgi:hypothetical protein